MSRASRSIALVIVAACGRSEPTPARESPPSPPADAAVDGITTIGGYDPGSGMHLDDDVPGHAPVRPAKRAGRPIDIMLRSTPPGARVHADGAYLGQTPTLWAGETGEHEFTFVLPHHALARYRFHAISTGLVHARLVPIENDHDPGVPPPEVAPPAISPPATLISPDASVHVVTPPSVVVDAPAPPRAMPLVGPPVAAPVAPPVAPSVAPPVAPPVTPPVAPPVTPPVAP